MSEKETDILARTIYGEARGESISGMEAVASVVLNRVAFAKRRGRFWWGNSIAEVCQINPTVGVVLALQQIFFHFAPLFGNHAEQGRENRKFNHCQPVE